MPVHASRSRIERAALERALLAWLIAAIIGGSAWLAALFAAGPQERALVAAGGGGAALALSVVIGVAVYYAAHSRWLSGRLDQATVQDDRLERRLTELVDGPLPGLVARLRDGAPPEEVLAGFPPVNDRVLARLLRIVVDGVAAGEHAAAQARADAAGLQREAAWLADTAVPALATRIRRDRASAQAVLAELVEPAHDTTRRVLHQVAEDIAAGERANAAALAACASAAARIQAQTTRMLGELRDLEDRYGDDKVFGDLLGLDHDVSQLGRLADSIALLSGGRSGRRWTKPIVMESVLRGAMGRIGAYQRVQYHSTSTAAVAGFAAEGVIHALAELMDNAANFSPQGSAVHVYVEEEDAGIVVTIEDGGLGMRQRERQRAERLVSEAADLGSLPGTRLGLAVVGRLARKHDLRVSFRPSSRGGIGVVVLIPAKLVIYSPLPEAAPARTETVPAARRPAEPRREAAPPQPDGADSDDLVLPKRRRGAALASAPAGRPAGQDARPRDTGTRFAAFRQSASGHASASGHESASVAAAARDEAGTEGTGPGRAGTRAAETGTGDGRTGEPGTATDE
ncbi:ATP-binding protein [Actinomadura sp. KC345]|uniref:sensor histidine kinase n=1 Tax=Actinomadura sp. KC345 TaxID=2530371 RepID=UPI002442C958|nr:ATP-binding protein [Actinomadura sp. KC345]